MANDEKKVALGKLQNEELLSLYRDACKCWFKSDGNDADLNELVDLELEIYRRIEK